MSYYGPWIQLPDVQVPLPYYVTHTAKGEWHVVQSFAGPHPYDDPAAGECAWNLARGPGMAYGGLPYSGWSADLSFSGYVAPPACPVLPPPTPITVPRSIGLVGAQYESWNNLAFGGSEVNWRTWTTTWGVSLTKAAYLGGTPTVELPVGAVGYEWDLTEGQFGEVLGASLKAVCTSGPVGDPAGFLLYEAENTDVAPGWGPYGFSQTGNLRIPWVSGNPAPRGTLIASSDGYSDTPMVELTSGQIAAGLAYEAAYGSGFFIANPGQSPSGIQLVGLSDSLLSSSAPAFPGRPSQSGIAYHEVMWNSLRSWTLDGFVTVRPRPIRYLYDTIPPLRWRQRDDGLGLAGAGRARSGSSVQRTLRHRGGYR